MATKEALTWISTTLGKLFRIKHGYAFKGDYFSDSGPFVLLTPGNFNANGGIKLKGKKEKYYTGSFPEEFILQRGDLIVVMTDLTQEATILGSPAFIPRSNYFLHNQRLGKLHGVSPQVDKQFLYYLFNSDSVRGQIKGSATGSTVRHTAPDRIYAVKTQLPLLPIQRKIASILSAYDNLIENNLRRIKILEEMAQNLYREWFVKFRFPGYQNARFVDSSLGKIPEGWKARNLGEQLVTLESGKRPKGGVGKYKSGVPSVGAENVNGIGRHDYESEKYVPYEFFQGMRKGVVKNGDVALYKDGAYIGKSTYFRDGFPHTQFSVNEHVFLLRTKGGKLTQNMLYLWMQDQDTVSEIRATNANAAQPGINQVGVRGLSLIVPTLKIASQFDRRVEPSLAVIISLAKRNQTLRQTRDLLLPKLISGEIDVSNLAIPTRVSQTYRNDISQYNFVRQIAALPFVDKIVLFGSRARGDHHSRSDIDLAVFCDQASEKEWQQVLYCLIEDRLDTLLKIDCVRFDAVNTALKEYIMTEGKTLYEKKPKK